MGRHVYCQSRIRCLHCVALLFARNRLRLPMGRHVYSHSRIRCPRPVLSCLLEMISVWFQLCYPMPWHTSRQLTNHSKGPRKPRTKYRLKGNLKGGWRKTKGDGGEKLDCFSNNQVKMLHFSQLSYHSCANWMIHLFCNGWGLSCGGKWLVGATFACHGDLIMLLNFSTEMITEGQWSGDPQSYVATQ